MVGLDRDALICDFAETYHVLNYRELPARLAATLAAGLGPNSRIRLKEAGINFSVDTMLRAVIADATTLLLWLNTKNGQKGKNRPKSLAKILSGADDENATAAFDSAADFERWHNSMLNGGTENG